MKRRTLLKHVFLIGGVIWVFPGCGNTDDPKGTAAYLDMEEEALLGELVDLVIPSTDTPGARELGVHLFVIRMVSECRPPAFAKSFKQGMGQFVTGAEKAFGKKWKHIPVERQLAYMEQKKRDKEEGSEIPTFLKGLRELTVKGYMNSEYVMTKLLPYQLIPGYFKGCVPVSEIKSTND